MALGGLLFWSYRASHEEISADANEDQAIKNPANETSQQLRRIPSRSRIALTGTPVENGLGDLWAILDFTNPGLVGSRPSFIAQMRGTGEEALRALNGILLFRRTKAEPEVARELPDKIDELDYCSMTPEQIGLYQAVLDTLLTKAEAESETGEVRQGVILAAITALKQICNHPAAYRDDGGAPLRSGTGGRVGAALEREPGVRVVLDEGLRLAGALVDDEPAERCAPHQVQQRTAFDDRARWNGYVEAHPHASAYHRWEWGEVFADVYGTRAVYLLALRDDCDEMQRRLDGVRWVEACPLGHLTVQTLQHVLRLEFAEDPHALREGIPVEGDDALGGNGILNHVEPADGDAARDGDLASTDLRQEDTRDLSRDVFVVRKKR